MRGIWRLCICARARYAISNPWKMYTFRTACPKTLGASQAASSSTRQRNSSALACLPKRGAQHAARRFRRRFKHAEGRIHHLRNNFAQGGNAMLSNVEKGAGKKNVELSLPPVTTIVILKKKGGPTREVRCSSLDSRRICLPASPKGQPVLRSPALGVGSEGAGREAATAATSDGQNEWKMRRCHSRRGANPRQ